MPQKKSLNMVMHTVRAGTNTKLSLREVLIKNRYTVIGFFMPKIQLHFSFDGHNSRLKSYFTN